jgi:hypothetical protein
MDTIFIKTIDGAEVVGEVVGQTEDSLTVRDPLVINYRFQPNQSLPTISMTRYMPFAIDPVFNFKKEQLQHTADPKPGLIHYWRHAVSNFEEYIDDSIEHQMIEAAPLDTSDTTSDTMEHVYQSLLENMDDTIPH